MATGRMARVLTEDMVMAAGQDEGNRSMRQAGRTAWSREDWNVAARAAQKARQAVKDSCRNLN